MIPTSCDAPRLSRNIVVRRDCCCAMSSGSRRSSVRSSGSVPSSSSTYRVTGSPAVVRKALFLRSVKSAPSSRSLVVRGHSTSANGIASRVRAVHAERGAAMTDDKAIALTTAAASRACRTGAVVNSPSRSRSCSARSALAIVERCNSGEPSAGLCCWERN